MNFNENQTKCKNDIKYNFLTFLKNQYVRNLEAQKMKQVRKNARGHEYDKILKDLLSKILSTIGEQLLVQWFVIGIF